jgi:nicotinate-nucleotide adenylyltransferase
MVLKKRPIGFFGGSFNPIHIGHLIAAEQAREFFSLETIYFIPTWASPHKTEVALAPSSHRVQMIEIAIHDHKNFSLLLCDIQRQRPTYSVDTLQDITEKFPCNEFSFHFIVGSDSIQKLPSWKSPAQVLSYTDFYVAKRQYDPISEDFLENLNQSIPEAMNKIHFFPMPYIEISSSMIRNKIYEKKSIQYLVPNNVASYIDINNLYKEAYYRKN